MAEASITTSTATVDGLEITYRSCGAGPLALCLHGFPDSADTWRHLLPELAAAGFRAVAPFTRGYAPTAIPTDGTFQIGALAADANGLHETLGGEENAVIVGHDWGASTVYAAAASEPERWSRVVALAVPPGPALATAFLTNPDQLKRSWYMFFFQHALSDLVVSSDDLAFIDMLWRDWSPGFEGAADAAAAKACLREPGHLAAALGYYRATLGDGPRAERYDQIEAAAAQPLPQPTLYLHGRDDGCIGFEVAEAARETSPWATIEIVEAAGHFLHLEAPEPINRRIVEFVSGS